ncbi:DUF2326 domain-containing protein (plasmid) [Priestia megaterium]|uniref:DUF2326 domain-containing protein n=1 Tax=Priestia megaterium TaxID=1404 RepID=UPI00196B3BF3|nr:DUF2326 domain-containing protein [Priestia megaterium]QSF36396.1 DUF2326 domain-containing protein [Priestia megaterium]
MKNSLFISRVTTEPKLNNFDVTLRKGLNIIYAKDIGGKGSVNSVGKSTFVKLVNFGLGSNVFLNSKTAKKKLSDVYLLMELTINGTELTVKRKLIDGDICEFFEGWKIDEIRSKLNYSGEKLNNDDYKSRIENLLFSNNNYHDNKKIFSVRQFLSQLIRVQGGGFEFIDKPLGINETADLRRQRLQFLTGLLSEEIKRLNNEIAKTQVEEKEAKKTYEIINMYIKHKTVKYKYELEEEKNKLEIDINALEEELKEKKNHLKYIYKKRDAMEGEKSEKVLHISKIVERIDAYNLRILNYDTTCNEIDNESVAIDMALTSQELFKKYPYTKCPTCLKPLSNKNSGNCVAHQNQNDDTAVETIKKILSNEKEELKRAIKIYKEKIVFLNAEKTKLKEDVHTINKFVDKTLDELISKITILEKTKESLYGNKIEIENRLNTLEDINKYEENWKEEKEKVRELKKDLNDCLKEMDERLYLLSLYYNEIVEYLYNKTKKGRLTLSPQAKNIQVAIINNDGVGEEDRGDATNIMKVVAFDLALLKFSELSDVMHPKFLIHDSPNARDTDPEVYKRIMQYVLKLEEELDDVDFQYIITTILLPDQIKDDSKYIRCLLDNSGDGGKLFGFTY